MEKRMKKEKKDSVRRRRGREKQGGKEEWRDVGGETGKAMCGPTGSY